MVVTCFYVSMYSYGIWKLPILHSAILSIELKKSKAKIDISMQKNYRKEIGYD